MNKNRSTLLIVVVLLLVSVYFIFFRNSFSTLGGKDNDFAVQDTGSITKIRLSDKNNQVITLTRIKGGVWKVNDRYFVRSDGIKTLLYTIKMVTVKNLIDQKQWDPVIKQLATSSVKVEIFAGDNKIKEYYVGGGTPDYLGTYMLLANPRNDENYQQPYVMYIPGFDGFLTTRFFTIEDRWRDQTILRYYPNEIKSVTLTYPSSADHSFTINQLGKNRYSVENPVSHQSLQDMDTAAVKQYLTYFQYVAWEVPSIDIKRDSILASTPVVTIDVKDTLGKVTDIKLFNRTAPDNVNVKYGRDYKYDPDRLFAYVNGRDFVLVQYYVFGKLLQDPTYFMHKRGANVEK
jgi:hypothetical protein